MGSLMNFAFYSVNIIQIFIDVLPNQVHFTARIYKELAYFVLIYNVPIGELNLLTTL